MHEEHQRISLEPSPFTGIGSQKDGYIHVGNIHYGRDFSNIPGEWMNSWGYRLCSAGGRERESNLGQETVKSIHMAVHHYSRLGISTRGLHGASWPLIWHPAYVPQC